MKTYQKPELKYEMLINSENIAAGLEDWMTGNELMNTGVTTYTYVYQS